ncbi:hydrophobic surface binding protein A-domain-containing protein [Aspergillus granulosus]|uniref:Hydrophobic surface binding protein A-domain-containing protein n=1 Tax=Aspergillus granulosus TaxID=176169 RepID=A0ABR4HXN9_9EURO
MKFSVLSSLALVTPGVLASPTQRDVATIQAVVADIQNQVNSLQAAIESTPLDPDTIITQSNALVSTIEEGTVTVKEQEPLTSFESLDLIVPIQSLAADVDSTVQSLISVKADINKLGEGCTTLKALQAQAAASDKLADAIVAKIPADLEIIAVELAGTVSKAIQNGVDAYEGSCDVTEPTSTTTTTTAEPTSTTTTTTRTACPAPTK